MTSKKNLAIFGSGGHGKVIADCALLMGNWEETVFFDDALGDGYSFQGLLNQSTDEFEVIVAIGDNKLREKKYLQLWKNGFDAPIIKHPASTIASDCEIGAGSVLMAGAIVNPGALLGRGCIVNTSASVDHDCQLGDFIHIAPGAHLAGGVTIKDRSWIGIGAKVIEYKNIGKDVIVAAGAVVITDIVDNKTVMGIPAK